MTPEQKPKTPTLKDLLSSLALIGLVTGTQVSAPQKAEAQKVELTEKKYKAHIDILDRVVKIMDQDRTRIPILERNVKGETICKFNREWTQKSKKELETIWKYVDKQPKLPEETQKAFAEFLEISLKIRADWAKKSILFSPIKKLIGTHMVNTEGEMKELIRNYFDKPPKDIPPPKPGENECSFLFNQVFSTITGDFPDAAPKAQDASTRFIKGIALLLKEKINKGTEEERAEALEITRTLGKIIFEATK